MKKIINLIAAAGLITALSVQSAADEYKLPKADGYVLIEAETGEILYSHNGNTPLPISSLAKIMSLLIIAEEIEAGKVSFSDNVPVSAAASSAKGAVIWLEAGEIMTVEELVKAVVISSANDAAIALSEYIAGSGEEFTGLMNSRAVRLGMNDTFFADCGGFDERSYSTARDTAVMTAELFKHNVFREYFTSRLSSVRAGTEREAQLLNTNKLAHRYRGLLGGKAGQSAASGFCLANCAERNGFRLICVVLGAKTEDDRVDLCEHLMDSGFIDFEFVEPELITADYSPVKVEFGVGRIVETIPDKPVKFVAKKGEGGTAKYVYTLPESVPAPVSKGQTLGGLSVILNGKIVREYGINALYDVEELTFKKSFIIMARSFFRF